MNKWDEGYYAGYEDGRRNAASLLHHELMSLVLRLSMSQHEAKRAVSEQLKIAMDTIWDRDNFQKSGNA